MNGGGRDDKLTVDALAAVAGASRFHFHRQFTAEFGISVYRYVQLARLKRAAFKLAYRPAKASRYRAGERYDGPEAFSRAFKQLIGKGRASSALNHIGTNTGGLCSPWLK
jgi:AraC family transcriptional regulator